MNGAGQALAQRIDALMACVCELLATTGAGPACWCGFFPGAEVSWDYCGQCEGGTCGMAYIRIVEAYQSAAFPDPDDTVTRCQSPLAVQLAVGALRCMPVEDDGSLPDPDAVMEASIGVIADMTAMWEAISCCDIGEYAVGNYTPLGPQGGCVGGEWLMWVSL